MKHSLPFFLMDLTSCSELEDVLRLPEDDAPTLSMLDSTLRRFIALCATYHGTCLEINWSLSTDPSTHRTVLAESTADRTCLQPSNSL